MACTMEGVGSGADKLVTAKMISAPTLNRRVELVLFFYSCLRLSSHPTGFGRGFFIYSLVTFDVEIQIHLPKMQTCLMTIPPTTRSGC